MSAGHLSRGHGAQLCLSLFGRNPTFTFAKPVEGCLRSRKIIKCSALRCFFLLPQVAGPFCYAHTSEEPHVGETLEHIPTTALLERTTKRRFISLTDICIKSGFAHVHTLLYSVCIHSACGPGSGTLVSGTFWIRPRASLSLRPLTCDDVKVTGEVLGNKAACETRLRAALIRGQEV